MTRPFSGPNVGRDPTVTRTSDEWREAAEQQIDGTLDSVLQTVEENHKDTAQDALDLRRALIVDDVDRQGRRDAVREMEQAMVERAHALLDCARDIRKLRTGPALRNLEGKEPVGYSKRDGGATTDLLYGSRAQGTSMARRVRWPLDLSGSDWEKETAERTPGPTGDKLVEASGVEKYTRTVSGRAVSVVLGRRPDPV